MIGFFPYGFQYPSGFQYSEANPDPIIEAIRLRMDYLNEAVTHSTVADYIFAAALDLFQSHAALPKERFWDTMMKNLPPEQLAVVVDAISDQVTGAMPRLDFPNAIALFDCRFIATKEWEHIRRYSIGGSEAATVLGLSHYQSPRSLYFEKKAPIARKETINQQHIFDYGHNVEPHIIESNAATMGAILYPEHRMFAHKKYPFLTCNPDGILLFPDGHLALFEAKTAFRMKRDEWVAGIPDYYAPQPRQYLEVFDDPRLNGGYIGVCLGGDPKDRICHSYLRDPALGAEQIQKAVAFWNDYIVPGILPPLSGNSELDMQALYKYTPNNDRAADFGALPASAQPLFDEYSQVQAERKALSKTISEAKNVEAQYEAEIQAALPAELTVCTSENGVSYVLRAKETVTFGVDTAALGAVLTDSEERLLRYVAASSKDVGLGFTTPKIKATTSEPSKKKGA